MLGTKKMRINQLNNIKELQNTTEQMPVLFIGHGCPLNAIHENEFVKGWSNIDKTFPKPSAILCISAHWETRGTYVTAMIKPETIHDFGGFSEELYSIQYPTAGSPELANRVKKIISKSEVRLDEKWGLDHGCWSILKHIYPDAGIPVVQLSLDYSKAPQYHFELAKELATLRKKGVLIIGSGNMVHNLKLVVWDKLNSTEFGYDWAIEAGDKIKKYILNGDFNQLINYKSQGKALNMAIPTPDHFLPLLYALALKEENERVSFFNEKTIAGSLNMTSLLIANT